MLSEGGRKGVNLSGPRGDSMASARASGSGSGVSREHAGLPRGTSDGTSHEEGEVSTVVSSVFFTSGLSGTSGRASGGGVCGDARTNTASVGPQERSSDSGAECGESGTTSGELSNGIADCETWCGLAGNSFSSSSSLKASRCCATTTGELVVPSTLEPGMPRKPDGLEPPLSPPSPEALLCGLAASASQAAAASSAVRFGVLSREL
mmetsp:Transcript_72801/g.217327  ORF Transcript_72801/g.217327 Transcript_72801/m.217327 type:complete len:207 (-) Transcript_72801:646-1266(-)